MIFLFITTIATSPDDSYEFYSDSLPLDPAPIDNLNDMFTDYERDLSTIDEPDMNNESATPDAPQDTVEACEDFGSSSCFANNDCAEDGRCENVGSEDSPIACCVSGGRGALQTGEACDIVTGQQDCASSLCIAYNGETEAYCSGECQSDEDCPESMPSCISVAFSGSDLMWCFPASN